MSRTEIIRPAAVLPEHAAIEIIRALELQDVTRGGVWNATSSVWQRYDRPWDVLSGMRGGSRLVGTIAVAYDTPNRFLITVYRVTVTEEGLDIGWDVESLCDDAFSYGGLSLAICPRADLTLPAAADPFRSAGPDRPALPVQRFGSPAPATRRR